jgi:hypothetical protein
VRPHLAARRAMNAEPRDRAIPVPEERILRVETVEASPLERVRFDVPTLTTTPITVDTSRGAGRPAAPSA